VLRAVKRALSDQSFEEKRMSNCLLRMAGIYFVLGVTLGIVMGASNNFTLMGVHAHLNLLGWVSLGLIGLIYKAIPAAAETKLAKAHLTHGGFVHPVTTCMTKAGILHG
jgi:Mg/Co/Ni transporter MgtE